MQSSERAEINRRRSHRVEADVLVSVEPPTSVVTALQRHDRLRAQLADLEAQWQSALLPLRRSSGAVADALDVLAARLDVVADGLESLLAEGAFDAMERQTVTLSSTGMSFVHDHSLAIGARIQLHLALLPQRELVKTDAEVVRCAAAQGSNMISVRFIDLCHDSEKRLNRHILMTDKNNKFK